MTWTKAVMVEREEGGWRYILEVKLTCFGDMLDIRDEEEAGIIFCFWFDSKSNSHFFALDWYRSWTLWAHTLCQLKPCQALPREGAGGTLRGQAWEGA